MIFWTTFYWFLMWCTTAIVGCCGLYLLKCLKHAPVVWHNNIKLVSEQDIMIFNGTHLTSATSAFAPPLFLPRTKIIYIHPFLCPAPNHMYYILALPLFSPNGRQWILLCYVVLFSFLKNKKTVASKNSSVVWGEILVLLQAVFYWP